MSKIPNFKITDSDVTYVAGNQTNHNYAGVRAFNPAAVNPDPQVSSQDTTGRTARSEPSQASPPPQSFAAYSQQSQQHYPQYQPDHSFQGNPSYPPPAMNLPPDLSENPNHTQQSTTKPSYPQLPTPAQSPSPSWAPRSSMASTPQSPPPNPPFSHPNPSNTTRAAPPTQPQGQTSRRSSDRGPVPARRKY